MPYLTEAKLLDIINQCKSDGSYSLLIRTLGEVFSSAEALSRSFQKTEKNDSPLVALLERAPADLLSTPGDLNKEAVRSLQGEDKEEDSSDPTPTIPHPDDTSVDLPAVRRAFSSLWALLWPGIKRKKNFIRRVAITAKVTEIIIFFLLFSRRSL